MSQSDGCSISDILGPEIWNEREDLGRDLVDWCEMVLPESDQAEDLGRVLLETTDLKEGMCERPPMHIIYFVHGANLSPTDDSVRDPAGSKFSHHMQRY